MHITPKVFQQTRHLIQAMRFISYLREKEINVVIIV